MDNGDSDRMSPLKLSYFLNGKLAGRILVKQILLKQLT